MASVAEPGFTSCTHAGQLAAACDSSSSPASILAWILQGTCTRVHRQYADRHNLNIIKINLSKYILFIVEQLLYNQRMVSPEKWQLNVFPKSFSQKI